MKLFKAAVVLSTVSAVAMATPVFAAGTPAKETKVVTQGDGYTVTTETGSKKVDTNQTMKPTATSSYNANLLATAPQSFSGSTNTAYGNGTLSTTSTLTMTITHSTTTDDLIALNGQFNAYWSGSSPSLKASNIYMAPGQVVNASQTVYSMSIPAGVSSSASASTQQYTWITTTIPNAYQGTYNWGSLTCNTPGHWTSVQENDNTTWQFGSYNTAQINSVKVSIY